MRTLLLAMVVALGAAGCGPSSTQTLQERTADVTAAAKRDAGAIARGVAQGLARKGPLNINTAGEKDLAKLPGVTAEKADSIVAHRPYAATRDLVRKKVLTADEYSRVKAQIVVQ